MEQALLAPVLAPRVYTVGYNSFKFNGVISNWKAIKRVVDVRPNNESAIAEYDGQNLKTKVESLGKNYVWIPFTELTVNVLQPGDCLISAPKAVAMSHRNILDTELSQAGFKVEHIQ